MSWSTVCFGNDITQDPYTTRHAHTHTHTHTHAKNRNTNTETHTHTDSDEYSIVGFCKNATIIIFLLKIYKSLNYIKVIFEVCEMVPPILLISIQQMLFY